MKRFLALVLALFMVIGVFVACDSQGSVEAVQGEKGEKGDKGDQGEQGIQGEKGEKGQSAIAPQIRINPTTNEWEVSNDNGKTWVSTGVKATVEVGSTAENLSGLDFYPLPDGTYGVIAGNSLYLDKITIPATYNGKAVTQILPEAFENSPNLKEIIIPDSVTSIGFRAFYNCRKLTSVTIGNSVTNIGDYVFRDCTGLTSITIPDSVTSVGSYAFYGCTALTSITVDENNTVYKSIDGNLYSKDGKTLIQYAIGKTNSSFTIPDSVTSIGDHVFANCINLTSITIPNSVTSINVNALFSGCYKLVEVINKSNLNIPKSSSNNNGYSSLEVHNGKSKIVNEDGYLFYTLNNINYLVNYVGTDNDITLPANYNGENYTVHRYAFYKNDKLTSVTIPDSVTSTGPRAFNYCTGITSVTILNSVTSIGYSAFEGCTSLTSVTIPNSVMSIGYYAFTGCTKLTSVDFKNTEGWKAGSTSISSTDLKDKAKAADYLTDTYSNREWTRS